MQDERSTAVRIPNPHATAAARANAYYALARAFDRPDHWPGDLGDLLVAAFSPLTGELPELARAPADNAGDTAALAVAHAKLFIGPFEVQAAPWASFYLDPEQQLMGPVSRYAATAYAEAGLAPSDGPTDAPDHVTHELEFMYFLAFQEATEGDAAWRERQRRFWREHLGRWLPKFAEVVEEHASGAAFYAGLARLTRAFCAWEGGNLGA
jgi:TorA maturation chaperone TorD